MLNTLYGDDGNMGDRVYSRDSTEYGSHWATKTYEKRIKKRRELNTRFWGFIFFWTLDSLCCCLKNYCSRRKCIKRGLLKYRKFNLALLRLSDEQDIQYLIGMNRISSLLHKMTFLTRQRLAVNYSYKYVITTNELERS